MLKFLQTTEAQVILWSALGVMLLVLAFYLIGKFRPAVTRETPRASELIANFRDLHSQGQLDDNEYRKVKTLLAERLNEELKPTETLKSEADEG